MGAIKYIPEYNFNDYLKWEGHWELYDGIAISMSPMASPSQQKIASNINTILQNLLNSNDCDCNVYQPIDVKIDDKTVVNPDLLIICGDVKGQFLDRPPELVVEIVSPSSRERDKVVKYSFYQSFGIKYYLIIDFERNETLVYELNDGVYKLKYDHDFTFSKKCSINFDSFSFLD